MGSRMKYIVVVGDGMADYPVEELDGKTPLQVANKPNMDRLASEGRLGLLRTVPEGMYPDSTVANFSILGYDPRKYYTGRGPLEAGALGVKLGDSDVAFRCNLITEGNGRILDYSAGHVSTEEAAKLIGEMGKFKAGEFHVGVSYRHIFVLREGDPNLTSIPPHDIVGEQISRNLLKPEENETAKMLNKLMLDSRKVLSGHPVNLRREKLGKNPANMIWLWGQGRKPRMETLEKKYGVSGAVISAVSVIKGIGVHAGMDIIDVPGATGYYDTDYEGKAEHALRALEDHDLVFIHVEAPDEAGHSGDLKAKIKAIEDLDGRLVGKVLDGAPEDCRIAVLPDHPTPLEIRVHVSDPVPFAIYTPGLAGDKLRFDESSAKRGSLGEIAGEQFMRLLLGKRGR